MKKLRPFLTALAVLIAVSLAPSARAADLTYTELPLTSDSELILNHKALAAPSSNTYSAISTATTTACKSGSGVLVGILVTTVGSSSTATVYDNTAGSGTKIATINTDALGSYLFNCRFATGLTIVTVGTPKITAIYR